MQTQDRGVGTSRELVCREQVPLPVVLNGESARSIRVIWSGRSSEGFLSISSEGLGRSVFCLLDCCIWIGLT